MATLSTINKKSKQQGIVLLVVLSAMVILLLLTSNATTLLTQQRQITINDYENLIGKQNCHNALQSARLWLQNTQTQPATPTDDNQFGIWSNNITLPAITSDAWWQLANTHLGEEAIHSNDDLSINKVTIGYQNGNALSRHYQIISRCQNKNNAILSIQSAHITVTFAPQTTLPMMDWQSLP